MENAGTVASSAPRTRRYWQAQGLAELALSEFQAAQASGDRQALRRAFYRLASYYARTLSILRSALGRGNVGLARAAMSNLLALHRPLARMHRAAPDEVPITLTLGRRARDHFVRDRIVRVLSDSGESMTVEAVVERIQEMDVLGHVRPGTVQRHLDDLVTTEQAERVEGGYRRTNLVYAEINVDALSLESLVGSDFYARLARSDFHGLSDVEARPTVFRELLSEMTGIGDEAVQQFFEVTDTLRDTQPEDTTVWRHAVLIGSPYPRPYQYEAYAVFRGRGYQGTLIESPTGSGKTMIGMMCIQDWLRSLRPGQSILVLVPTSNYQQQWIGELCYKPIGLRLAPENVFSGSPAQLERFQRQTGGHPAVLLVTYAALAQAGSGVGKGGFDVDSIEIFLQGANVHHVILDEVHKVVEDMRSVSADVTRVMVEWLQDSSIQNLIGFSGTAEGYRARFAELGLDLAYNIPLDDLIAYGFVAPFAEFGVPFSNSARERQIRGLLDAYKGHVRRYLRLLGGERLRAWLAEIPMEERTRIGHDLLGMYAGKSGWKDALTRRLAQWEEGGALTLPEATLVTLLQVAKGWSDAELAAQAGVDKEQFEGLVQALQELCRELVGLIYLPETVDQLTRPGFASEIDVAGLRRLSRERMAAAARIHQSKDLLATTITGLYRLLSAWYLRVGEGRVETIKAVIEAERSVRPVSGIIVFDHGRRIRWGKTVARAGYEGGGGLFAEMLGDERFTAFAALSSEMYFSYSEDDPLPPQVARFIEQSIMRNEVTEALFGLATQGLELDPKVLRRLHDRLIELIDRYIPRLADIRATRRGQFRRSVLNPFRRTIRRLKLGTEGKRLLARLYARNVHLVGLVQTFFDYALLASRFRRAFVAELEQVSGARQKFFVVRMPGGNRKQLMYDLTSRIVDAESLPINLVIVSGWARTGWNVIKPNVLIDATATRNVTAWQQLRGRAIRALSTWTNDCYRLSLALEGSRSEDFAERTDLSEDVTRLFEELTEGDEVTDTLDDRLLALLDEVATPEVCRQIAQDGLIALTDEQRTALAIDLMKARNKVTHIYELVKAFGSTSQVTYQRRQQVWRRKPPVALKHAYEVCVQPFTGEKVAGEAHAPLLYVEDPRMDLPAALQARVAEVLKGRDDLIVEGWMAKEAPSEAQS